MLKAINSVVYNWFSLLEIIPAFSINSYVLWKLFQLFEKKNQNKSIQWSIMVLPVCRGKYHLIVLFLIEITLVYSTL